MCNTVLQLQECNATTIFGEHAGEMTRKVSRKPDSDLTAPDIQSDRVEVRVKAGLEALRDLRDQLVRLVLLLVDSPNKRGYLLLIDPKVSISSLQGEFDRFTAAMRPPIAERLYLIVVHKKEVLAMPQDIPSSDRTLLNHYLHEAGDFRSPLPRPNMQSEVFRVLLLQWLRAKGSMTSSWIAETVGCNYRTVAATIDRLGPAIARGSDRRVELKYFPEEAWREFLPIAPKARATMMYQDRSQQPRSPESLVHRLRQLDRRDIGVGGVIGAARGYPDLDIVGAPRLDLCVHACGKYVDLDFVQQLDPALERTRDWHAPVRVALHFLRRKDAFFYRDPKGHVWADPVECLLDLFEARLDAQALAYLNHLSSQRQALNAGS